MGIAYQTPESTQLHHNATGVLLFRLRVKHLAMTLASPPTARATKR